MIYMKYTDSETVRLGIARIQTKLLGFYTALVDCMGHTQGIIPDKQYVASENLTIRYVPKLQEGVGCNIKITHYLNRCRMMCFWFVLKLKRAPITKTNRFNLSGLLAQIGKQAHKPWTHRAQTLC